MNSGTIQILIAIIVAYIAYQNYKINSDNSKLRIDKLRFDLFEKRYAVYRTIQEFIATIIREGCINNRLLGDFNRETSYGEFLFGSEITDYIKSIYKKGCDLILTKELLDDTRLEASKRSRIINDKSELLLWFGGQFDISRKLFDKYLSFSVISLNEKDFCFKIKRLFKKINK